nr:hypothetical protein [Agrilactobacillus composti]
MTYTVNFQGAGDQTPAPITKTVTWTGVINSASNGIELRSADANASGVWTPDTTDIAVDVPEIAGYTADKTKVFTDPLAQTTTEPTDQTVTVTYTKIDTNVTTKVNFVDENNEVVGSIDKTGEATRL